MTDREIAQRYLEALAAHDLDSAEQLLAPDAEIVMPDETTSGAEFIAAMRAWPGLDNLDVTIEDRVLTEEGGVIVSRARRVFRWKESGDLAYEQAAETRLTIIDGKVARAETK
jgi:ketosteroid isomerase-like protein